MAVAAGSRAAAVSAPAARTVREKRYGSAAGVRSSARTGQIGSRLRMRLQHFVRGGIEAHHDRPVGLADALEQVRSGTGSPRSRMPSRIPPN